MVRLVAADEVRRAKEFFEEIHDDEVLQDVEARAYTSPA
jgi:hypothetical protein